MNVRSESPEVEFATANRPDAGRFICSPAMASGLLVAIDVVALSLSFAFCLAVHGDAAGHAASQPFFTLLFLVLGVAFLMRLARLYEIAAILNPVRISDSILLAVITTSLFYVSITRALRPEDSPSILWIALLCVSAFALLTVTRIGFKHLLVALARNRVIGASLVVLGAGRQSERFLQRLQRSEPYFTHVIGVFDPDHGADGPREVEGRPVIGGLPELVALARAKQVDDVVIALPWNADRKVLGAIETLKELPVNVYLSADLAGYELAFRPAPGHLASMPMFELVQRPIAGWSSILKTAEDYVFAGAGLILIAPLLALITIAIKLDSPGPVFFKQKRLGFNNLEFNIYKFRTMRHDAAETAVVRQATRGDARVTRVGRILRASSLDELPQLFNVLNGTMSLVGPRPHALSHNEEYGHKIRGYFARHRVKPGITGWAQVNGLRGETELIDKMEARIRYDIFYADNWSLLFDIRILIMTVLTFLFQKSAY